MKTLGYFNVHYHEKIIPHVGSGNIKLQEAIDIVSNRFVKRNLPKLEGGIQKSNLHKIYIEYLKKGVKKISPRFN